MMTDKPFFVAGFVEAALFTAPEESAGALFSDASRDALERFAGAFYDANEAAIAEYSEGVVQAGHDLWFTFGGHGVGYWENAGEPAADALDAAVTALGRDDDGLYEGDDGLLYWEGV